MIIMLLVDLGAASPGLGRMVSAPAVRVMECTALGMMTPRKLHTLEALIALVVVLVLLQQLAKVSGPLAVVWAAWNRLLHAAGNFQARLILTLLYALVVLPFGLIVRLFTDPLRIKHPPTSWLGHSDEKMDLEWARKQ